MAKVKIIEVGQLCRHCQSPVERREHKVAPKHRKGGYYYSWWLACPGCSALYMVESAKVMIAGKPLSPLFAAKVRGQEIVDHNIAAMFGKQRGHGDDPNEVPW